MSSTYCLPLPLFSSFLKTTCSRIFGKLRRKKKNLLEPNCSKVIVVSHTLLHSVSSKLRQETNHWGGETNSTGFSQTHTCWYTFTWRCTPERANASKMVFYFKNKGEPVYLHMCKRIYVHGYFPGIICNHERRKLTTQMPPTRRSARDHIMSLSLNGIPGTIKKEWGGTLWTSTESLQKNTLFNTCAEKSICHCYFR